MTTSRMIFGAALGFALAAAVGCGSKPEPTQPPATPHEPEPNPTPPVEGPKEEAPKAEGPKAEAPKVVWELDPSKHQIPNAPVSGTLGGAAFVPSVVLEGGDLKFRAPGAEAPNSAREITITLPPGEGRTFKVKPDEPNGPALPKVFAQFPPPGPGQPGAALFPGSHAFYALTLELGPRKDGKATGRVYLSLQDNTKTVIAGTFTAEYVRPHTEQPGADDAPYLTGGVAVTGADPKAEVWVSLVAFLSDGPFFRGYQLPLDPRPVEQAQWVCDNEKPRTSVLIAGDGKGRPFRYEYTRLKPGRYLVVASVVGGPAVWKWVEVPANGMLTENLALDATKTGGLEVTAAADATGNVLLVPADDPARPPLSAEQFNGFSVLAMRFNADIVAGKALIKNLGPGRYEVRLGAERRVVDVVAGKTAEVNLTPPKK
ncbi:MAG TPA: hypothetical protein VGE74_20125 [Gemmata sp.]